MNHIKPESTLLHMRFVDREVRRHTSSNWSCLISFKCVLHLRACVMHSNVFYICVQEIIHFNVLVVNAGSSSLKYGLFELKGGVVEELCAGLCDLGQ